ncbi:hypothetical protein NBRC116601_18160 [Cognatishimia sp. WU-CL00825]|uniref:hypothetical protein n=1 Tax=Cognatishimia sp. WU-CL00825 TaxID=3127658 RepID=UPI0031082EDA
MNQSKKRYDFFISLVGIVLALLTLFVWIPTDIDTGVIDVWRRSVRIGDAMLPTFAAVVILGSSTVIGLRALHGRATGGARAMSLEFMAMVLAVFIVSIAVMWHAGPALVSLWFSGDTSYRSLIDTVPWNFTGFVLGGALMIFGFIAIARHRVERRDLGIALVATIFIALLYAVPFDNLYLPPNGDF